MENQELSDSIRMFDSLSLNNDNNNQLQEIHHDSTIIALLLKIKKRDLNALQQLTSRAREFGHRLIFNLTVLLAHGSASLSPEERRNLHQAFDAVVPVLGSDLVGALVPAVINLMTPQLTSTDAVQVETSRNIVVSVCNSVGFDFMVNLTMRDVYEYNDRYRMRAVQVFAAMAVAFEVRAVVPVVAGICSSSNPGNARDTGLKIVEVIATLKGHGILPYLGELVRVVSAEMSCKNTDLWTVRSAALAIDSLARAAHPYGGEALGSVARMVFDCMSWHCSRKHRKVVEACLKAMVSVVGVMEEPMKGWYAEELVEYLPDVYIMLKPLEEGEELREAVMGVYKQFVCHSGDVSYAEVQLWLQYKFEDGLQI